MATGIELEKLACVFLGLGIGVANYRPYVGLGCLLVFGILSILSLLERIKAVDNA